MAQSTVTVNIQADTVAFERDLKRLGDRLREAFDVNALSLAEINPWAVLSRSVSEFAKALFATMRDFGQDMAKVGEETRKQAETIGATEGAYSRLADAAERANVSQRAFVEALGEIKNGNATLEETAERWERIAAAAGDAASATTQRTRIGEIRGRMQRYSQGSLSAAQWLWSHITHDYQAAQVLQTLRDVSNRGLAPQGFTYQEVAQAAWGAGRTEARRLSLGQISNEQVNAIYAILMDETLERRRRAIAQEQEAAEQERAALQERRDSLQAGIDADAQARRAKEAERGRLAARVYADERRMAEAGVDVDARDAALSAKYGVSGDELGALLHIGAQAARDAVQDTIAQARARQAQAREQEQARAKEQERKAREREALLARKDAATARVGDLRERLAGVGGDLPGGFLTAAGGSLIGNGSFTLAMANRLRAIDRAEGQQAIREELAKAVEELKGINEKLED